jgi:hypothetical protein
VEEGGETVFPASVDKPHKNDPSSDWSTCAKRGIAVKAVKGDALLFWSLKVSERRKTQMFPESRRMFPESRRKFPESRRIFPDDRDGWWVFVLLAMRYQQRYC